MSAAKSEEQRPEPVEADTIENAEDDLKSGDPALDAATKGQATSGYETLTLWETVRTFKVCTAACFAAAFSAATDGYQVGWVRPDE